MDCDRFRESVIHGTLALKNQELIYQYALDTSENSQ